jgi:hypothetical protein
VTVRWWLRRANVDGLTFSFSRPPATTPHRYFGDTSKLPAAVRKERNLKDGGNWDETMFNVFRLDNGTVRHFWGRERELAKIAPILELIFGKSQLNVYAGEIDVRPLVGHQSVGVSDRSPEIVSGPDAPFRRVDDTTRISSALN